MDDTFSGSDFTDAASVSSPEAASEAAIEESPAPVTEDSTPDPAATVQAEATVPPAIVEKPKGPIPFEVHSKALENARIKASEEALAKHREQFGWAEKVDRAHIESMARMGLLYEKDRGAFTRQFFEEGLADPQVAPLIRSEAARMLGSRPQPEQSATTRQTTPIVNERNEVVGNLEDIVAAMLAEQIGPIKQHITEKQQAEKQAAEKAAYDRRLDEAVSSDRAFVEKRTHWKEHGPAIQQHYAANPHLVTLKDAYFDYVETTLLPNLSKTERTNVVKQLQQKTAASSVSPSSGTTSLPIPDDEKSWEDLLAEEAKAMGL